MWFVTMTVYVTFSEFREIKKSWGVELTGFPETPMSLNDKYTLKYNRNLNKILSIFLN